MLGKNLGQSSPPPQQKKRNKKKKKTKHNKTSSTVFPRLSFPFLGFGSLLHFHYNLIFREEEREMASYCQEENIAMTPYSSLASGRLAKHNN